MSDLFVLSDLCLFCVCPMCPGCPVSHVCPDDHDDRYYRSDYDDQDDHDDHLDYNAHCRVDLSEFIMVTHSVTHKGRYRAALAAKKGYRKLTLLQF